MWEMDESSVIGEVVCAVVLLLCISYIFIKSPAPAIGVSSACYTYTLQYVFAMWVKQFHSRLF